MCVRWVRAESHPEPMCRVVKLDELRQRFAEGTIAAIRSVGFEVINLGGGGEPVSLNTLIKKLETLLGKESQVNTKAFHKADIKTTSADISKAKALLDWVPRVDLDEGLRACVDWHNNNKPWSEQIELP